VTIKKEIEKLFGDDEELTLKITRQVLLDENKLNWRGILRMIDKLARKNSLECEKCQRYKRKVNEFVEYLARNDMLSIYSGWHVVVDEKVIPIIPDEVTGGGARWLFSSFSEALEFAEAYIEIYECKKETKIEKVVISQQ